MSVESSVIELVWAMTMLLLIASSVMVFCKRFHLPFTVVLVIVGLAIHHISDLLPSCFEVMFNYNISPNLIIYVCLPTLLFESSFNMDVKQFRQNIFPILTLVIPGLVLSTLLIGIILASIAGISLSSSLLLGAILSATDPVAVVSLFKQLGVPKRLLVLVEGESLLNDATSIVMAKIIFTMIVAGVFSWHQVVYGIQAFLIDFFGGAIIGGLIGVIFSYFIGKVESDADVEISITIVIAYLSFIVGQNIFHVSGVVSVVTAAIVLSSWGRSKISPKVSKRIEQYWEFLSYVANALIFLLVGLSADLGILAHTWFPLLVLIGAILFSRGVVVFGLIPLLELFPRSIEIDRSYQTVMWWGGLRGAIALAMVLGFGDFKDQQLLLVLSMGVVLFGLIVQATSIEKLMRYFKMDVPPLSDRLAKAEGHLAAKIKAKNRVPSLEKGGLFSALIAKNLNKVLDADIHDLTNELEDMTKTDLLKEEEERLLLLQCFSTQKNQFYRMFSEGHFSENTYRNLTDLVENQMDLIRHGLSIHDEAIRIPEVTTSWKPLINIMDKLPLLNQFSKKIRSTGLAREYEQAWGRYQGLLFILEYLKEVLKQNIISKHVLLDVQTFFKNRMNELREKMDSMAEYFPEFTSEMQNRLAQRMILQAELESIEEQSTNGVLPSGVAENIKQDIESKIIALRERVPQQVVLSPSELLRKVDFFQELPENDFKRIASLLKEKITHSDEKIIKQGEVGNSLFIIMRGVVRVVHEENNVKKNLATLMAGDFFGEMALIHNEPRTASCISVTPCALYELKKQDFDMVKVACPTIQIAIEEADKERRETD